ncbi:multidrug resistance protein ABC superfamily [Phytophthora cinnamomi]|uniref:multidrug resistance protein ABC superfamily n=1 Tax=Phytophthora cinnamomi TaxID=4785 RepID=UPI00355A9D14|nr:multidrug resistance protein ABC superfamily [Phytophthora cinnamomi]
MADSSHTDNQQHIGGGDAIDAHSQSTTARSVLLKRNPHLRDSSATSSPAGFGALGTRQFLHKQLMTPGSATSASSFEEGASFDGFSDAGTPASEQQLLLGSKSSGLQLKAEPTETVTHFVTRSASKQPTKRLSSPSRESLARRLMGTATSQHGMLPDDESVARVDTMEWAQDNELPPSGMLSNMVVKTVPTITVPGEASASASTVPLSPRSAKVTRRIVASPRKTLRRVVMRRTDVDGKVHEDVQYVDADGQVAQGGNFFNAEADEAVTTFSTSSTGTTTVTRSVSTPGKTLRRVVVQRTGADGQVREDVQFVDADGHIVESDDAASTSSVTTSSTMSTPAASSITRRIVTPGKLSRRILRRTGADGQVLEQVQYLDADGNVVQTEGASDEAFAAAGIISTSSNAVVTRRTVTPGKTVRRVLVRKTGADGQVHEEAQFVDADGNVVQSDGSELVKTSSFSSVSGSEAPGSSSGRTMVTRRVVSPGQTLKRVIIRRRGADGELHEEVQYVDADGNVIPTEGSDLAKSGSFTTEETITHEGSADTPGRRKVTRRIIRRMLVRKDGTRVPVEQIVDADGQIIEGEGGSLVSVGSFTGSVSSVTSDNSTGGTSSRRTVTRRVVASPVRRSVVHKAGSSSGAESEDDVQYIGSEGVDLASSGSFTRTVTTLSTPGRRIITRRVVTPQRVVRRMVVRKGTAGSSSEAGVDDDLDIDAEFVQSEGTGSSDESVGGSSRGGSSRGGYSVSDRIVIPGGESRRVVSRSVVSSNQPQEEVEGVATETNLTPKEKVVTSVTTSENQSEVTTPTRIGVASVTEPEEGSTSPEATKKIGLTPGVIWDYFTKNEEEEKPASFPKQPAEDNQAEENSSDEEKAPIPASAATTTTAKTAAKTITGAVVDDEESPNVVVSAALAAAVAGAAIVTSTIVDDNKSPDEEVDVAAPEEGAFTVTSVDEPVESVAKTVAASEKDNEKPRASGGFWSIFGKSEENQAEAPSSDDEEPTSPKESTKKQTSDVVTEQSTAATTPEVNEAQQQQPNAEDDEFVTPQAPYEVEAAPEVDVTDPVESPEEQHVAEDDEAAAPVVASLEAPVVPDVVEEVVRTVTPDEVATSSPVNSPRNASLLPEVVAGVTDATLAPETQEDAKSPRHVRRGSGGGFWGFFGKSEEPKEDSDKEEVAHTDSVVTSTFATVETKTIVAEESVDARESPSARVQQTRQQLPVDEDAPVENADVLATVVVPTAVEGVATTSFVESNVDEVESLAVPSKDEEDDEAPRGSVVLPAIVAARAGVITAAALAASHEPDHETEEAAPGVVVTSTITTETVEEESQGGFWGFFSKSEPKVPRKSDAAPIEEVAKVEEPTPASPNTVVATLHVVDEIQQDVPVSQDGEVENPGTATFDEINASDDSEEEKTPVASVVDAHADVVDVPEHKPVAETMASPEASSKSPRDTNLLRTAALAGAAGVATAVVVKALETKEPDTQPAAHSPTSDNGEIPVDEESAAPVTVAAPPLVVTTTQTTTMTTEESESLSKAPPRKTGRSIWKFWGDKPASPQSEEDKMKTEEERIVAADEEQASTTEAASHTPVLSAGEARQFWRQQDQHNPTQLSYAAAEGTTYGPESRFESIPATDKLRSPVARSQGATAESPRDKEPVQTAVGGGVIITSVTTTTVEEEEEEFETGRMHYTEVAADAVDTVDIAVVAEAQHPVQRESIDREEPKEKEEKPARAGFFGFFAKKDTPEKPVTTVVSFDDSEGVEGDEAAVPVVSPSHDERTVAAAAAVVQVEELRRSIPSDSTPKNVGAAAVAAGKQIRDSERRTTVLIDGAEPDIELDENYLEIASPRHSLSHIDEDAWAVKPCSLAWSNLRLNRKSWRTAPVDTTPSGANEIVLDDVSGSLKAREFLVITGPSKDESLALLSCLAGYEDAMEGNVTVNGRQWNEKMNRYIAYVMREDLFYETLTVHEHLVMQAKLRMHRTHTDEMCLVRVERVIEDMGLSDCRDKLIGGGISLRGITRGERKLLAIATALLTNPSILLVEEPTDGLDTFSAEKIVAKLRWLAFEQGLTVAVTLHHPSSHFYGLFDALYLVADASCVYDGKAADCVAYFSTIGYQCPEYMSPMDYLMLQMVVGDRASDDEGVARVEMLKREWANRNAAVYADNAARAAAASEDAVVDDYDQKNRYYHMGCCGQLWLLWARHVRRLSRYGFVFWWHLLAALLIGVVFGLVYLQLDLNDQKGIQNFNGSFFYVVVVFMLFIAYRTFVFMPRETAIALRERQEYRGGWYHLLCWYFTKIVAELPALIILSIALFVPVFLLVGIGHGFKVYVYMLIVLVLAGWAAIGLGFLTLGVLRNVTLALIVYTVLLVLFVAFGGLLINVTDIPDWLVWLHYISPVKYAYEAMMKVFWKRVDSIDCDWTVEGCVALTGDGVLKYYSMENRSALGDSLILFAICFAFFFFAFWFLLALANKRINGLQWRYDWSFKGALGSAQQRIANATMGEKHAVTRSIVQRVGERKSQHSSSAAVERSVAAEAENYYIRVETPRVGAHAVCDAPAITLGWSSLWLKAQSDKKTKVDGETQHQQYLLSDASGSAKCGELVLVTGPSDKSNVALLGSLGGLQKRLKGKVTLNGVASSPQQIVERAAYVARDDLFYETLTVEEHLQFQAQLVVGKSTGCCGLGCGASAGELEAERVEMVLDELELIAKRHMLIRYLSPADSKMLAIATALLINPSILLVEEPTSGMDFYSSQRVVLKLRQLARGGRTVVVTMTHPSSHLYALFDVLYLLAGGAAVYHGKVREAVPYFASLGYQCPQYMSPVDYFIRQVSARGKDNETSDAQATLFKEAWSTRYSELCLADNVDDQEEQTSAGANRRRVGCCGQLSLLFQRHVLRLARYRAVFGWHAFWMIVLGVIFGLIFLQLDLDNQQDIQNWAGAFFFIVVLQMLVMAYRTFVFLPREMAVAEREHRSGRYYMVCWYLTKVFTELPAMMILSILLFVPAYLLIGIGHGFKLYFFMQLVMWLAAWSAAGMATLLLGLFRRVRVALIVYMLLLILFVVFGGLLINVDDVPDYLIWLHYISPVKYGYEALMKLFWGRIAFLACGGGDGSGSGSGSVGFATVGDDYSFSQSGSGSLADDDGCVAHSGDEVLSHYSMESRDARSDSIILLELTVLYFFIGYAFLSLRWRRYKTRQQKHSTQEAIDN